MDQHPKPIQPEEFKQKIKDILINCRQTRNFDINIFVKFASQTRKQINNTPNAQQICKLIIIESQKCLLEIYAQQFKEQLNLDQFFTIFIEYEKAAKHLNLACYHVCQNLSYKATFQFWKIAVCKIIKDNSQYIQQSIFKQLESLLESIYKKYEQEFVHKKQESEKFNKKLDGLNSIMKFQTYNQILLELSKNEVLIQRNIDICDDFCQMVFKFMDGEYQQKYMRWHQVYSVKDYLIQVERELELNEQLFSALKTYYKFKDHYTKIQRIVYETLLLSYKRVVLKDERGFLGLLKEFLQSQEQEEKEIAREEIILILRVYSKFQDKDIYFNDFKQNFQIFVRKAIEEQYKEQTLHHELEKQKQKYKSLVKILCDIYDKFNNLIILCFRESNNYNGRYDLEMIVKSELNLFFINLEQSIHLTQQLCDYVHDLIMQMSKTDDQQQRKENYDEILKVQECLLPFVKDYEYYLIINYYRLASRLLSYLIFFEKSHVRTHLDNETQILDQMKSFCGDKKLKKFYKMISEISDLALNTRILAFDDGTSSEIIQINKKKWPILYDNDRNVFEQIQNHKDQFYKTHNLQYNVVFSDTISYVEVYWAEVNKTLMINCVQAAILFLYDKNEDPKSLNEIIQSTKLQKDQVLFQLDRMVKLKILWADEDSYYLNNSQIKLEIENHWIVMEHNIYENERFINEFKPINDKSQDFKYQLDAFIMKILKLEKRILHKLLLEKVTQHFYPILVSNEQLKLSIEFLSKYQYISRDPENQQAYLYQ
ncbi:unnamed protein product [Paramecium pentaurelia]|uniref:Cullin family profile domain-containing protein n=1 Tax=Paramecium pentaurelia TaxID=43138 RepID=A0A8S1XW94_9CILI|nr:unnamed protein product [Paramecium pentaurelia]